MIKKTIQECIQEYDDSTGDAQDDVAENVDNEPNHGQDAAGNDGPRKRKQGRCLLCDRSKDKKAHTACNKCGCLLAQTI